ncbi:hypothetical protein SNOG_00445 [Parastagonospora nodorum SN15]|uniref:alpha-1,2-Mannosidase n=1 Tax=Phaeosphaeria nodorum (strain SN15 / ATCC MYA-4574 / FGSC 10173) TaxID=321614 RepID=Q0V6B9_PHANO|nr:hypothetical protein SNOG_00445 [Parastagonospora nodorum SN15]EAT91940.2 hypothetical protein SNOG_00445 [Parastagonospora nodorum SN15]
MTDEVIAGLRQETRDIFYHGYDNYMEHAFPEDELRPLTCGPLTRDRQNPAHIEVNDVLGNYSLTLIDSLSTLAILASSPSPDDQGRNKPLEDFQDGIKLLVENYGDGTPGPSGQGARARGFDLDSKVQVFETVIRGVGGLLSAHQFAIGDLPIRGYAAKEEKRKTSHGIFWPNGLVYDGQLLRLANDLADRLLPAFHTPTGLPYPRVNLRHGVPFYANSPLNMDAKDGQCGTNPRQRGTEITETCSAGAASLVLEFSTLSRLTGNPRYEESGPKTLFGPIGLIGGGIDAETGQWVSPYTGIGAGIDSFFEYALKTHILLSGLPYDPANARTESPDAFLAAWEDAHDGIKRQIYRGAQQQHPSLCPRAQFELFWIDSLSAFYQGLLAMAGKLDEAIETHLLYTALWTRYSALPERWSTVTGNIEHGLRWWGGRPEWIESTWYLYHATKDPWYLHTGEMALRDIKRRCWTKCGWAGLQDAILLSFQNDYGLVELLVRNRHWPNDSQRLVISATAARSDIFHAASLARLHLMPVTDSLGTPIIEYSAGHPSVSHSNIHSPSNFTYYPWTLPLEYIPRNATSSAQAYRTTFDLSFPNMPNSLQAGGMQRVHEGILVSSMSGLRLGMVREEDMSGSASKDTKLPEHFRIYAISNTALGRDEKVFMSRATMEDFNPLDPFFTRTRDTNAVDLILDVSPETADAASSSDLSNESNVLASLDSVSDLFLDDSIVEVDPDLLGSSPSYLSNLLASIQSLLSADAPSHTSTKPPPPPRSTPQRYAIEAALPLGPGAEPLPDTTDPELVYSDANPLPWHSIYVHNGQLCEEKLDADIPKKYQVIAIPRGGCSFSDKLRNIPAIPPKSNSLQVVIIVSSDAEGFVQPLLDDVQHSPSGLLRPHPIPLIMVNGGDEAMEFLKRAKSVGVRRRYHFLSQGIKIGNLIVL